MKHPEIYDGKQDIEAFDNWVYSVTNYADVMRIRERTMIRIMAGYVAGTAKEFYSKYVAGNADDWTFLTIFPAIFDYCFPQDFMKRLRIKWDNTIQGKRRVREYVREIELIGRKFPEMTERTTVLKFWSGLNSDLREIMAMMDAEPEIDYLNDIISKAERAEKARDERNRERLRRPEGEKLPSKREWTRFKNRSGGNKNYRPGNNDKSNQNKSDKIRANAMSPQSAPGPSQQKPPNQNNNGQKPKFNPNHKKLSREMMNALRVEGKCFNCREKGHEQRNCPKLESMKPPKPHIKAGSIRFADLEELSNRKDQADLYSGHISVTASDPIADELREIEEDELRVHRLCELAWGEDPLWHTEETRPDCKYSVGVEGDEITVWDFANGGSRTFDRRDIDDPKFDIADIFSRPETNRTPSSVREGGYPPLGIYQRCDWPAINWLHARLTGQLEFADGRNAPSDIKPENRIDIQPTMDGYSVQLDESDVIYNMTHEEVLDDRFSPERIINLILSARQIPSDERGDRFEDRRFSKYVTIMLGMMRVPGQQTLGARAPGTSGNILGTLKALDQFASDVSTRHSLITFGM